MNTLFTKPSLKSYNYQVDRYKGTAPTLPDEIPLRYKREPSPNLGDGSEEHKIPISSRYQ